MSEKNKNEKIRLQSLSASQRWLQCTASLCFITINHLWIPKLLYQVLCAISEVMLRSYFFNETNQDLLTQLRNEPFYSEDKSVKVNAQPQLWQIAEDYVEYVKGVVKGVRPS